jgi:photosystem II stability/assembly factor-like uncharacterized protein
MKTFLAVCALFLMQCAAVAGAGVPPAGRMFATVLLVRGSVVGNSTGGFGLYVRSAGGDTSWTKITKGNIISFGIGYFDNGRTRRHYLAGGNGLHRSTDGGMTWKIITSWRTEEILGVVPDPVDSALIYVATPFGVFKTTDDGLTWNRKMNGITPWYIQRITMDPRSRSTLYAAGETDLFRTTDGGESWRAMGSGCRNILALLQHPVRHDVILIAGEESGIRRTTDGGATWSAARGLEGTSVYTFRASADGRSLYAAGWKTGVWRSTDDGASWEQLWTGPDAEAVYSLFVDPANPAHLMVGSVAKGLFESLDGGAHWKYAGLNGAQVKQIEIYP